MPLFPIADLHRQMLDTPSESKYFQFHAVFMEIWQNRMSVSSPPLGEILDQPLIPHFFVCLHLVYVEYF